MTAGRNWSIIERHGTAEERKKDMLYCAKCRTVCEDYTVKCPNCGKQRLYPAGEDDMVLLRRTDLYTAQKLGERLEAAGVAYETKAACGDWGPSPYDSEAMPTDQNVYVKYGGLSTAQALLASLEEEREGGETFEEMPRKKRILVQIVSAIAFLALIMLTVYGADAIAGWLKSVFGL